MEQTITPANQEEYAFRLKSIRQLENDMKAFQDDLASQFKKHQKEMDKLESENNSLIKELQMKDKHLEKVSRQKAANEKLISSQQEEILVIKQKVESEKELTRKLDESIQIVHKEIIEQKRKHSGISSTDRAGQLSRQHKIIENRLEKANNKYSEVLATNKEIRQQIDIMRRERVIFEQVYFKLEKDLGVKRKDMAQLIQEVTSAFEDRDFTAEKLARLKLAQSQQQDAIVEDIEVAEIGPEQQSTSERSGNSQYQKLLGKTNQPISYLELADRFIKQEETNFSAFNAVNKLNSEVENVETEVVDLKGELERIQAAEKLNQDAEVGHKAKAMLEIEEQIRKTKQRTEELLVMRSQMNLEIEQVTEALKSLGSGSLDIQTDGKKESLLAFLATIEEKLVEILVTSNQLPMATKSESSISNVISAMDMLDDKMAESNSDEDVDFSAMDAADFRKKFEQMNNLS